MNQVGEPPFPNDHKFIKQIEAKIEINRHFPFVKLKSLLEENIRHLATLNSKHEKRSNKAANPNFKCHICSKRFINRIKLTNHLKRQHPEVEKPFACSVCQNSYKTCKELNFHLGKQHPDQFELVIKGNLVLAAGKKHECPHCLKKFICKTILKKHIVSHTKDKAYVCDVCGSKFSQDRGLQEHKLKKNCSQVMELKISKEFQCNHCEVSVGTKAYLKQHIRIFHGIINNKPKKLDFICLFCGYKAPDGHALERHNRIHTGEKPFKCKACTTAFAAKHNLDTHIRKCEAAKSKGLEPDVIITTEADIRDAQGLFKCSFCIQTFKTKCSRNDHQECHGDRFTCKFCPAGFKTIFGLQSHKRSVHLEQIKSFNFNCNICEKPFSTQRYLKKHRCPKLKTNDKSSAIKNKVQDPGQIIPAVVANGECFDQANLDSNIKDSDESTSIDHPISSWVKSVTNSADSELDLESMQSGDVIPITVLKMEQ